MTPSLVLFFSLCAVLAVLMAVVVIVPWLRRGEPVDNQLMSVNVQAFHERLAELDADKASGVVDETNYQAQIIELKRQLLAAQTAQETHGVVGIKSRLIVLIWIPILVAIAYLTSGDRTPVFNLWAAQNSVGQVADDLLTGKIDTPPEWATKDSAALISAMQTNVHYHAYDANRWVRLSELFMMLDAKTQALEALSRANRLEPDNTEIAITYAQTSFFANEGKLDAKARSVVLDILKTSPKHEGALMLMAMGDARAGDYPMAKAWIGKLRSLIASHSGDRSEALASLDALSANIAKQEQAAAAGVQIAISVSPALLAQVQAQDVLFVSIAEQAGGPPYAVKRLPVSELKDGAVTVSLSDLDAMLPERTLTAGRESGATLVVNARISRSGTAISESGDLMANPVVLQKTTQQVALNIAQIVP